MQIKKKEKFMNKVKKLKQIPHFKTEKAERKFWVTHDSTEYLDWSRAKRVSFPNLKPSSQVVTIRMPLDMVEDLKLMIDRQLKVERAVCLSLE